MFQTADYKVDATIKRPGFEGRGVAHVLDVTYSKDISFCNFVMHLAEGESPGQFHPGEFFELVLENGKEAAVSISFIKSEDDHTEIAGAGNFQKG